jgi:two-component system sensor histidine kinase/response regulator
MSAPRMVAEPLGKQTVYLSSASASRKDARRALSVVLLSLLVFAAAVPFAREQLLPVPAFIPIYQSILVVNDTITAVLLFAQFSFAPSRALLVLASAYLFTALIAAIHLLTFPGLFTPTGLLGAGPQSTAWLYMFWHATFPVAAIAYGLLKRPDSEIQWPYRMPARIAMLLGVAAASGLALAFMMLATAGRGLLPPIMQGNRYTPIMIAVVSSVWLSSFLALAVLWVRRPHALLDIWLMVVLCAWIFDIGLSAVLNGGRFDLGFYAGRIYGLLAASYVLLVLLLETGRLYERLLQARTRHAEELQRAHGDLERAYRELKETQVQLIHTAKMTSLGELVAGIAHETNNPLAYSMAHLGTVASTLDKLPDEAVLTAKGTSYLEKARRRAVDARGGLQRVTDLVARLRNFSRLDEGEFKDADIRECVESALEFVSHKIRGRDIEIETDFAAENQLFCAPGILNQAFFNLLSNAADAVGDQGRIRVRTGRDDKCHWIAIADSGPGISDAIRERIFEPFFTTKEVGKGTGLGLSITYRIVDRHKGAIDVARSDLGGAEFIIRLPLGVQEQKHVA